MPLEPFWNDFWMQTTVTTAARLGMGTLQAYNVLGALLVTGARCGCESDIEGGGALERPYGGQGMVFRFAIGSQ